MFKLLATVFIDPGLVSMNAPTNDVLKGHSAFAVDIYDKSETETKENTLSQSMGSLVAEYECTLPRNNSRRFPFRQSA